MTVWLCDDCFAGGEELSIGRIITTPCAKCGRAIPPEHKGHAVRSSAPTIKRSSDLCYSETADTLRDMVAKALVEKIPLLAAADQTAVQDAADAAISVVMSPQVRAVMDDFAKNAATVAMQLMVRDQFITELYQRGRHIEVHPDLSPEQREVGRAFADLIARRRGETPQPTGPVQ